MSEQQDNNSGTDEELYRGMSPKTKAKGEASEFFDYNHFLAGYVYKDLLCILSDIQ